MKKFLSIILSIAMMFSCCAFAFAADDSTSLPFENSSFFEDGDYTIHYRTYNVSNPKNQIMMIHGFGLSTASLEGVAEEYQANGYKVVTVDMPNFGYSSRETADTTFIDREDLVYDLMQELGGKWILSGHSMGGGIAANVAIDHPDEVEALVLFAPQTSSSASGFVSDMMKNKITTTLFGAVIKYGTKLPFIMNILVAYSFSDVNFAKTYDCSRISDPLKIDGTGAGWAIMSSHTRGTDSAEFGKLTMPICILTCKNDMVASRSNLNALLNSGAENLVTYQVEKGGHMFLEYNPQLAVSLTMSTVEAA